MSLTYIGDRFLVGIPAADLTDEDVAALAKKRNTTPAPLRKELVESGLYRENAKPEKESKP